MAQDSSSVPIRQQRMGVPEIWPLDTSSAAGWLVSCLLLYRERGPVIYQASLSLATLEHLHPALSLPMFLLDDFV